MRNALIESTISNDILMLTRISKPALIEAVEEIAQHLKLTNKQKDFLVDWIEQRTIGAESYSPV